MIEGKKERKAEGKGGNKVGKAGGAQGFSTVPIFDVKQRQKKRAMIEASKRKSVQAMP